VNCCMVRKVEKGHIDDTFLGRKMSMKDGR